MSHLAELVANAAAAINQASDVAALDNVRVEYWARKGINPSDDDPTRSAAGRASGSRGSH